MGATLSVLGRSFSLVVAASISACAMSAAPPHKLNCEVDGSAKLPAASGGEAGVCEVIGAALANRSLEAHAVLVKVHERGRFAVTVTRADGTVLPELNFAQSDRAITQSTLARLAQAVANHLAQANAL